MSPMALGLTCQPVGWVKSDTSRGGLSVSLKAALPHTMNGESPPVSGWIDAAAVLLTLTEPTPVTPPKADVRSLPACTLTPTARPRLVSAVHVRVSVQAAMVCWYLSMTMQE